MKGDDDAIYVRKFKTGDEKAFDKLFEKYQLSVYSICYRYSRNEADARELTQDTFIKVYNNLNKFREKSKFFTWLASGFGTGKGISVFRKAGEDENSN
jgi:RNA polymerase sigma-70 factor (ECF subfamily)